MGKVDLLAMVVCFGAIVGIAVVGGNTTQEEETYNYYMIGIGCAIGVSWILALTNILVRHMRDIHFSVVLFQQILFYLIVSGILAAWTYKPSSAYQHYQTYIYLLAGGLFEFAVLASHTIAC